MNEISFIKVVTNKFYYRARKRFFLPLLIIDLLGYIIVYPFLVFKKKPSPSKIKKVLLIRLDNIGDSLLTTPCLKALRKNFPSLRIDVIVRSYVKEILANNPNVNKIYLLNPPWLATRKPYSSWREILKVIRELRKENYDIIFEMHGHPINILFSFFLKGYRVGYGILGLGFLLHKTVYYTPSSRHIIQRNLDLVRPIGAEAAPKLEIFFDQDEISKVDRLLEKINVNDEDFVICIHPGVSTTSRSWPVAYFSELINLIISFDEKIKILLCGSKDDDEKIKQIIQHVRNPQKIYNLSGKTSINGLALVIKNCKILIGLESLSVHLASAFDIPTVTIFCGITTRSEEWGPYGSKNIIIQKKPRSSLLKVYWKDDRIMKLIKPNEVFESVEVLISEYYHSS